MNSKAERSLLPETEALFGALIGLARATDSAAPTELTWRILVSGIASAREDAEAQKKALSIVKAEKARLLPNCAHCASPCGRNDDFDMERLNGEAEETCALKYEILSEASRIAEKGRRKQGTDLKEELYRPLTRAVFSVGEDWTQEELREILTELSEAEKSC